MIKANIFLILIIFNLHYTEYFINSNEAYINNNSMLYAIKYGYSKYPLKYIFYDNNENTTVALDWLYFVLKMNERIILIDTGFTDEKLQKQFGVEWKDPVKLLNDRLGIKPGNVTDVIITHNHFDHISNVDYFSNAKIYMQENDLQEYKSKSRNKKIIKFLANNENVITFRDEKILYDKIIIKHIGGHTIGSCVVYLNFDKKKILLTGDECYLNDNYLKQIPVGTYYDINKNRAFIESLINSDMEIYTFHDPSIVKKNEDFALLYEF